MIVTKSWLNEWIDLSDITTDALCKTLNSIGLEVDRIKRYRMPQKVVFGHVLECEKHPNADKLSVCKVDIGTSVRQIVCGAKNVRKGLDVVVATIGAKLPNGMEIKSAKLRGVESEGMICSSSEIGLAEFGEGIVEIDSSIGSYKIGEDIASHPIFNDDLIEIELTANRGDCLSIRGVARDLSAAFNRPLKDNSIEDFADKKMGIGRIFSLEHKNNLDVSLLYKAVEIKDTALPMLVALRLAQIEEQVTNKIEAFVRYTTHATGVIIRAYDYEFFKTENDSVAKGKLEKEDGLIALYGKERASIVGVDQCDAAKPKESETIVIVEASYIAPDVISKAMMQKKLKSDYVYYRSSRGSEPDLELGMCYFLKLLKTNAKAEVFGGDIELCDEFDEEIVSIKKDQIDSFIGMDVDKSKVSTILKNLGFGLQKATNDTFVLQVPKFRHDIKNRQDIVEEIVRLIGIDNIPSKPITFTEANRLGENYFSYQKRKYYRNKAAACGFYEAVHFVFDESESLDRYGFELIKEDKRLINPIVNTLDTLRPTLMHWLLKSASHNKKNGYNRINLFEVGSIFTQDREERVKMAFIYSGDRERDALGNNGKPQKVDFAFFVQKIADVIGDFELEQTTPKHKLANPYQSAAIKQEGKYIGELFSVHPLVTKAFDLEETFLCEVDFEALRMELKTAKKISRYQASMRDLSLLISNDLPYSDIKEVIEDSKPASIVRYYPVDRYTDEKLGEKTSLTLRFVLQSDEKTLEEAEINEAMERILAALQDRLAITLR